LYRRRKTARDLEEADEVAARELEDVELEAYTPARRRGPAAVPVVEKNRNR
jgi:hypothetical protein